MYMDLTDMISGGTEEQQVPEQKLTKEEYAAKKQQEREEVWAEVDSQAQGVFQDGEKLKGFLDFMAECNTQRTPNLLLIYGQHPDFKVVRSYERWREEHRSVKVGEHGITYMISTEYEKDGEMRRGYTIGKGFDISQMSGKPLEERPQRSLTELIGTVLKDQSVRVQIEDDLPDKVQAQYNPRYRTIYIRNGMSEVTTFHALNRELACAALDQHTGTYSRQKVSAQAYCAAYVIAKRYGVDVTGFNLEYIAQRNECGKKDPQELRDFLNDVRQASYSIRNHIERNFGAKEQEYVTDEFAIGDPVKTPETKDEKASGKEKKAKNQPEDYPTTQAALAFADLVAQRTDGRVKVLVYSGGELGAEQSVIQQMQFGGIDFSRVSLSQLAEYEPALSVLQLPYLYTDADQMWRVLDGTIGDEFLSTLESLELTGLSWFDAGVRSIYTRQKVTGLADLQGLTIRVQESDMMSEMITDLGAKPVKVVYSKVYAALHNGEIDGAENNWPSYEAMGHYEVAPYFLKDEHTRVPEVQLASPAVMEKLAALDERYPEIIRLCARESAKVERRLWAQQEAESESDLRAAGIEVTELDEEEKARFRAAVQPMYDRFAQQGELIARIRQA